MMPTDVVLVFALYWITTLSFLAWVTRSNKELDERLGKTGEQT
jgi:hypothetical protein